MINAYGYPPLVFLDMEGTLLQKAYHLDCGLVAPSAWTLLAEALGEECLKAENKTKALWRSGAYKNYLHWMQATIDIHKEYKLTESVFREIIASVEFTHGAHETIDRIHSAGAKTVLITGGFKALADRVQKQLRITHAFAACDYFFDPETGFLDHANLLPADELGKLDIMELMCREYDVSPQDCVFVGDGMNDVHLARAVGFSVAFNAQKELNEVASIVIQQPEGDENFTSVADAISHWADKNIK